MINNTPRNVVLICLDSVRKDVFDEYATRLADIADVQYAQCRSASIWSVPSHASLLTGQLPHRHGVHSHNQNFSTLERDETFLHDIPHRTVGVSANLYAGSAFGFDELFDDFRDVARHRRYAEGIDVERYLRESEQEGTRKYLSFLAEVATHDHPIKSLANGLYAKLNGLSRRAPIPKVFDDGGKIVSAELLDIARSVDEPVFAFANYMDAHGPLSPNIAYDRPVSEVPWSWTSLSFDFTDLNAGAVTPEEAREDIRRYRELYRSAVDYLDRVVASLIEQFDAVTDCETTYIITADHGNNLGYPADNGLFGHTSSLTEALLHVPLLIVNPPGETSGIPTDRFVSHLDMGALVTSIAKETGVPDVHRETVPAEVIGVSGTVEADTNESLLDRMIRCAYRSETKFQWDSRGVCEQYDIDYERPCWQERRNTDCDVPDWSTELFEDPLAEYASTLGSRDATFDTLDDVTRDRLSELGYLS